jgi:hypothetical protein
MQRNHSAERPIEQQVGRLTKVQEFHDSVNAILTQRQLELMRAMVGGLDSGQKDRHAP